MTATTEAPIDQAKLEQFVGKVVGDLGATLTRAAGRDRRPARPLPGDGRSRAADAGRARGAHRDRRALRARVARGAGRGRLRHLRRRGGALRAAARAGAGARRRGQPRLRARRLPARGAPCCADEPKLAEAFRPARASAGTSTTPAVRAAPSASSAPATAANLVDAWIPALDGVEEKLEQGAKVADVGCGHGASTIIMAQAFPKSTFVGFDYHDGVDRGRPRAAARGRASPTA